MRPYRFPINSESVALVPPILEHEHFHRVVGRVNDPVFGYAVLCVQLFFEQVVALVRGGRDDFYHDVRCAFDAPVRIKEVHFFVAEEDKVGLRCAVLGEEDGGWCCKNRSQVILRNMVHHFVKQLRLGVLMSARRCLVLIEVAFYKLVNMAIPFREIHFCESSNINIPGINFHNNRHSGQCNLKYKLYPKTPNRWHFRQTHFSHDQNAK